VTRRVLQAAILLLIVVAAYAAAVVIANRLHEPGSGPLDIVPAPGLPRAGDRVSILTWNLGYAGLGAASDFIADGGTRYLPPSRAAVRENLAGIAARLARTDVDVFLLQEVARAGPLNYWVDVLGGIRQPLHRYASVFDPEIETRLIPPPFASAHGTAIASRLELGASERIALPLEDERLAGLLRRHYRMHVARLPIAGSTRQWVIVNVHLAAFDRGAEVRRRQLREVLRVAEAEFRKGNPVVIGGDWNLEFVARGAFPHATEEKHLFWLHDFPFKELSDGWRAAFDPKTPSARTLHEPYAPGRTYVTVIDAFIVSPNVEVESVQGIDMGFAFSDHQPVRGTFRYRP
jgi:endonuclease/exonuclease/phosphatase family metal-dependent hydrolase